MYKKNMLEKTKNGDYMRYFIVFYRSIFFYLLIAVLYRIMGKREIGELSVMDFTVSIFMAELVAISIENYKESILLSIVPIITLSSLELLLSYLSLKNKKIRNIIDGEQSVIIKKGIINFKEMKKQRYNIDDLLTQLRNQSIKSIEEVDYAILESSGKLSIFKKQDDPKSNYPLPLIIDGKIDYQVLKEINKDKEWLEEQLIKNNVELNEIVYSFYKDNNIYIIEKDIK